MKNLKAAIPVEFLTGASFNFYAWVCGAILTRAHSRTGDPAGIAGYCGKSQALDEALAQWAESYGDQTEEDHERMIRHQRAFLPQNRIVLPACFESCNRSRLS